MNEPLRLLLLTVHCQRYALPLPAVRRVVRMVAITPLPRAPAIVLGLVNVHGDIVPVLDIRSRFGLPARPVRMTDQLVIAQTARRTVAIAADTVNGVIERPVAAVTPAMAILPGLEYVAGVTAFADGLVLIHDLDTFLSLDEEAALDQSLASLLAT
jgi:purine-binding chemotaxis protein CheW